MASIRRLSSCPGRLFHPVPLRGPLVRVMEAAQHGDRAHTAARPRPRYARLEGVGDALLQALMWPGTVEVGYVLPEHASQVALAQDEQIVQAFAAHAPQEAL